jgi:predicted O-methyltransferase YrrM
MSELIVRADKTTATYEPLFVRDPGFISEAHRTLPRRLRRSRITGKLSVEDQLTLFDLAANTQGDVLDVGYQRGFSTCCLAAGMQESGEVRTLMGVDKNYTPQIAARRARRFYKAGKVYLLKKGSGRFLTDTRRTFGLVFLDAEHKYRSVRSDLSKLQRCTEAGALLALHDFYHGANATGKFGVARAAKEILDPTMWTFCGRYGDIALFRRDV